MDIGWILLGCALIILILMAFRPWRRGGRKDGMGEVSFAMAARLDEYDARLVRRDDVARFLSMRQKIKAIKVYREDTGASLADAKAAVERMEQASGLGIAPGFANFPNETGETDADAVERGMTEDSLRAEVERLLRQNQKIKAIKVYREQTGVGLREAKEAVDSLDDTLRARGPQGFFSPVGEQDREMDADPLLAESAGEEVRRYLLAGEKIKAIKAYREQTGVSLKAAKNAVERLQRDMRPGWE